MSLRSVKLSDLYLIGAIALGLGALLFGGARATGHRDEPPAEAATTQTGEEESAPIKEESQPREYHSAPAHTSSDSLFESGSLGPPGESPP